MKRKDSDAVSPVIGVMLMLVVVIIIAAVVSAFAGGLSGSQEKSPIITFRGTFSQSDGLTIEHAGGDAIATATTNVMVRPSKTFGSAEHLVWIVNKSSITNANGDESSQWIRTDGRTGTKHFAGGDIAYVLPPYHEYEYLQPGASASFQFDNPKWIGRTFWLELVDDSGRVFARTEVTIGP